ncbi:MAG: thiamine-phosphate kinase [Gammaproteobacteria bacterium]|nr:MAG: thiamine-phosphate kinase [Gammaproteobacteria bacterium]
MREVDIIERYFRREAGSAAGVSLGIGDDAAVLRPPPGEELVVTTDSLVAGTHFAPDHPPDSLGHRSLAVNLSDLAAMGAQPRWFTLSLSLPLAEAGWLTAFAAGLFALADRHAIGLVGGDTVRGPLAVTVTAIGSVPAGGALRRDGAGPGERIFVTGPLGDAAWTWRQLAAGGAVPRDDALWARFAWPEPRVREGLDLRGVASAVIDLSDGLATDLPRLLGASGIGADCELERLPLSTALRRRAGEAEARALALSGGDDYELCFTVPPAKWPALEAVATAWPGQPACIGETRATPGCRWLLSGAPYQPPLPSFEHFAGDGR